MPDQETATAAPSKEEAAPVTAAPAAPVAPKASAKKPVKKKKKVIPTEAEFEKQVVDLVYAIRKENTQQWVDLRNKSKNFETLHRLLISRPVYRWRKVGESFYLEAIHTGTDTTVAYALPHDPGKEYRKELRKYQDLLKKPRRPKDLKEPKKPESMKKSWRWIITDRRGNEANEGTAANFEAAQEAIMNRKASFVL